MHLVLLHERGFCLLPNLDIIFYNVPFIVVRCCSVRDVVFLFLERRVGRRRETRFLERLVRLRGIII